MKTILQLYFLIKDILKDNFILFLAQISTFITAFI